ncbi:MAG: bifunctional folylpolyglutamate synthase/dihydrofolate synthase, partial [Kiritimatiellae bacterium]|nr:bifunctional folylpolyglutamate synthase/dihydrofolate synthase [Kiritimatiellia bacterium]
MGFLDDLAAKRRFGMKPGLDAIRGICAALGDPQLSFRAIHVAGTNGKGAVAAMLDSCLRSDGLRTGRYTSPHLVRINERFFLDGRPVSDDVLERASLRVGSVPGAPPDLTFFEALTAVAFLVYAEANPDFAILETGLGGRLDATNVCSPALAVVTRIGLDHCDWLGDTVEKIAAEKAGIAKPGVPVVVARNPPEAVAVLKARADELGAPFVYAPDVADESEIPRGFSLAGSFNRENAVTAIAALKTIGRWNASAARGLSDVVWPGRFQKVGEFIVDGAHNPPAAEALAAALADEGVAPRSLSLVAGFCADKDAATVLARLAPFVRRGFAVRTCNPRSLRAEDAAAIMRAAGVEAEPCPSLRSAFAAARGCGGR